MDTYTDCQAVKKALIKQIVAAVDSAYIKELRDPDTNSIDKTSPVAATAIQARPVPQTLPTKAGKTNLNFKMATKSRMKNISRNSQTAPSHKNYGYGTTAASIGIPK